MNTYPLDFDGTLVDSMPTYVSAMLKILEDNHISYDNDITKIISTSVMLDYINEDDFNKKINFNKVNFKFLWKNDLSTSSYNRYKTYTYKDFLYSFVMESSADCGYALMYEISDSTKDFSVLMNKKAKSLGMNNSHFDNPVGLDSKNNYSTMRDMVTFMKNALKDKTLTKIMSTFSYKASNKEIIYQNYGVS